MIYDTEMQKYVEQIRKGGKVYYGQTPSSIAEIAACMRAFRANLAEVRKIVNESLEKADKRYKPDAAREVKAEIMKAYNDNVAMTKNVINTYIDTWMNNTLSGLNDKALAPIKAEDKIVIDSLIKLSENDALSLYQLTGAIERFGDNYLAVKLLNVAAKNAGYEFKVEEGANLDEAIKATNDCAEHLKKMLEYIGEADIDNMYAIGLYDYEDPDMDAYLKMYAPLIENLRSLEPDMIRVIPKEDAEHPDDNTDEEKAEADKTA